MRSWNEPQELATVAGHMHVNGDQYVLTRGDEAEMRQGNFITVVRGTERVRYFVPDDIESRPCEVARMRGVANEATADAAPKTAVHMRVPGEQIDDSLTAVRALVRGAIKEWASIDDVPDGYLRQALIYTLSKVNVSIGQAWPDERGTHVSVERQP